MAVTDNKTENPLRYYRRRAEDFDPQELSRKSGVPFDGDSFRLTMLGRPVSLKWPELTAVYEDDGRQAANAFVILAARLVMFGTLSPGTGKMLSYIEIPWGAHYYKAFKGRCLDRLARTYGRGAKKLAADAAAIKAREIKGGDCTIEFDFMPGLTVQASVWEADDEFPASSQILFSDSFLLAFSAEELAAVGDTFMNALKGRW